MTVFHIAITLFLVYLGLLYDTKKANDYLLVFAAVSALAGWAFHVA